MRLKYELRIVDALSGLLSDAGSIPAASILSDSDLMVRGPVTWTRLRVRVLSCRHNVKLIDPKTRLLPLQPVQPPAPDRLAVRFHPDDDHLLRVLSLFHDRARLDVFGLHSASFLVLLPH